MALTAQDIDRTTAQILRDNTTPLGAVTKADIRAAIEATDLWIDANTASWNNAIPVAARTGLTGAQKTWLFAYVLMRRIGRLRAEED